MTPGKESEKAVSRTVRETLNTLQRTADELNQALNDLVAACGSTRPSNSLPPILRAQTAAASLAASLEVLSRFVSNSLQSGYGAGFAEPEPPPPQPARRPPAIVPTPSDPEEIPLEESPSAQPSAPVASPDMGEDLSPVQEPAVKEFATTPVDAPLDSTPAETPGQTIEQPIASDVAGKSAEYFAEISVGSAGHPPPNPIEELPSVAASFDVSTLLPEEQDLHRRANRVAKVSMQDIKMLRPNEVRLGREHRDICVRLRDDIEKAHKEYDRRFQSILGHPVDYFYDWMVQILADGDPRALGEYPYPSPALRR